MYRMSVGLTNEDQVAVVSTSVVLVSITKTPFSKAL